MLITRRCSDPACELQGQDQPINNFYKRQTRCIPCYKRSYARTKKEPRAEAARPLPPNYILLPVGHPLLRNFNFLYDGGGGVRLRSAPAGYVAVKVVGDVISLPVE